MLLPKKNQSFIIDPFHEKGYSLTTCVFFGDNTFSQIPLSTVQLQAKNALLVLGGHLKHSGTAGILRKALIEKGIKVTVYPNLIATSDVVTINDLTDYCRHHQFDLLIAVGGGAVMDSVKCSGVLSVNNGAILEYVTGRKVIGNKRIPVIAAPTTAGTGAEVTPFAVVWGTDKKYSFAHQLVSPTVAVVDPRLTYGLPKKISAEGGIDALTQSIEALWSKKHHLIADIYAIEAIQLVINNLMKALSDDKNARKAMSRAALFSGLAIRHTATTINHALSYPLTIHHHITHGQAVGVTLPTIMNIIIPILTEERQKKILNAFGADTVLKASGRVLDLMRKCHLKTTLGELGVQSEDIPVIIAEGYDPVRMGNSPWIPPKEKLNDLLQSLL